MTKDEILSRLLSDISDEFDKDVGSFFYDVTKPTSEKFETAYNRLSEILKNGFALTASGEYLDCKAAEQGMTRKSGVAAQVKVTVTGTPGSIISVGDKVASDSLIFSSIEIIEYPSKYCFAVKFTSKTGVPYNLEDIKAMIEDIKPAHLAVEYIFTYRLWQDILDEIQIWTTAKNYSWEWLLTFEVKSNLNIWMAAFFIARTVPVTERLYGATIKRMQGGMNNGGNTSKRYRSCHLCRCG